MDVLLVKMAGLGKSIRLGNLAHRQTADEDELTVPGGLHDLAWGQFTNVDLLVGVSNVARPRNHLVVDNCHDRLDAESVSGKDEALQHVDLCALDLVVPVLLVPKPVFVEPVISLGLGVKRVAEVAGTRRGHPVRRPISAKLVVNQFLVLAIIVLLQNAEVPLSGHLYFALERVCLVFSLTENIVLRDGRVDTEAHGLLH